MKHTLTLSLLLLVSGCAGMLENRSFIGQMDHETDGFFVAGRDFNMVPGDSGNAYRNSNDIRDRTPLSGRSLAESKEQISLYEELRNKEMALNVYDKKLYSQVEHYIDDPSEKIYFLGLNPTQKMDYLYARNISINSKRADNRSNYRSIASVSPRGLYDRELQLGMTKDQVIDKWGRPLKVEIAGNPRNQNERWLFSENGGARYVYFEGGSVQGWEAN
tara:strand:+ start:15186 stop:15839 length:654 start_codon:yes stop_codon:yes gene_type:complete